MATAHVSTDETSHAASAAVRSSGVSRSYDVLYPSVDAHAKSSACVVPARMPRSVRDVRSDLPERSTSVDVGPSSR